MYVLIKHTRLYRELNEDSHKIEVVKAFGKEWEPPTHSENDIDLVAIWEREYRYAKLKKQTIHDGLYKLKPGGKLEVVVPVEAW